MGEIRWGIIGCGNVTEHKSGPALQKAKGSRLTAVMRRDERLARDYAERHGVPKAYGRAENLLYDSEVDAVYIATPPSSHKDYALLAAGAGKPVYVEKPMGRSTAECEAMIAACKTAGVPLFVAYYRRGLPRFLRVKEWLRSGQIGDIRYVRTWHMSKPPADTGSQNWRIQPEISGGGLFLDLGSHTLDLLDDLLGPIRDVHGSASNLGQRYDAEDTVSGQYVFESGVHGTGIWCFDAYDDDEATEIVGTRGRIRFSTFGERPIVLETEDGVKLEEMIPHPEHVQQPLIQSIVDELLGRGQALSTGASAIRTARVTDALLQSFAWNG